VFHDARAEHLPDSGAHRATKMRVAPIKFITTMSFYERLLIAA
jgi:hypothetical protein